MATQNAPNDQKNEQADIGEAKAQNLTLGKNTVLIIDDERQVRETIRDILEMESVPVLAAANGAEGIAEFIANQSQIGLVILDLYMPGLSGADTFATLRELDPTAKIILSSGYPEAESLKKLGNTRPTGFLHKPYRLQTILHLVAEHLA